MRTVLFAIALLAAALGWWLRPQVIDLLRDDGTLAARFHVQRNWRGQLVARGMQEWFLPDGQCFRRQEIDGPRLVDGQFLGKGRFGEPVYPSHIPPDPPSAEYVGWLRHDNVPISTDLPSTAGERFSYP
ncbi:MAG TPA: hypothetical protein VHD36_17320 [Pirellulales bacterium]|nr:hypothetical protein [Pirellulales bacterium]